MSSISGVSSGYTGYGNIASGTAVSSASDGAAELSIIQSETAEVNALEQGSSNVTSAQSVLNISDAALGGISDYLQQIRELAIQASNGTLSSEDKQSIQDQIDEYKQGIVDLVNSTSYNDYNLLDGSTSSFSVATDGSGSSVSVSLGDATLDALGIADFDVTGDFDLSTIDDAIETVNSMRSQNGAESNALSYTYEYNQSAAYSLSNAVSSLEDLDLVEAISDMKKEELLQTYQIQMEKMLLDDEEKKAEQLYGSI